MCALPFQLAGGFWLTANIRIENQEDQIAIRPTLRWS